MTRLKLSLVGTALIGLVAAGTLYAMQNHGGHDSYADMHAAHHGKSAMHADAHHQHDEVNMPGLHGLDTTDQEFQDLKTIFQQHRDIERQVVNLFNGVQTTTESDDPEVRNAIVGHVAMMVARLDTGRNPKVAIQSPTLDALFDVHDQISTQVDNTPDGVVVTQTSTNPEVVALLQQHAAEVSDMSARGMQAVHQRMMGD